MRPRRRKGLICRAVRYLPGPSKRLIIAGAIAFVCYLGAVNAESRSGDPNMLRPILAFAWLGLIVTGIVWAIVSIPTRPIAQA